MATLARSRLVQFFAVAFLVYTIAPKENDARVIVVDAARVERALRARQVAVARPLSGAEKQDTMTGLVTEEVLYREGLRLGIGMDDEIVRTRIADRVRTHLANAVPTTGATDDELRAEISALAEKAPPRARVAFAFVAKDRPDAAAIAEATASDLARESDAGAATAAPSKTTDRPPIADGAWWTEEELARAAGAAVARAAFEGAVGSWSPPITAAWGFYIVRPMERRPPTPSELREAATLAVMRRHGEKRVTETIARAAADYRITVHAPEGEPAFLPHDLATRARTSTRTREGVD